MNVRAHKAIRCSPGLYYVSWASKLVDAVLTGGMQIDAIKSPGGSTRHVLMEVWQRDVEWTSILNEQQMADFQAEAVYQIAHWT